MAARLPVTLILGCSAIVFALVFSIPLGVIAAIRPNSWIDRLALFLSVMGQAMPSFWLGLMLIVLLSVWLPLLPPSGTEGWEYFVMPTIVLGYYAMPAIMRLTRAGMMEVLASDYIRTARAKGLLFRVDPLQTCPAQRHHPRGQCIRRAVWLHAGGLHRGRDGLRPPGHGIPGLGVHQTLRFPHGAGGDPGLCRDLHRSSPCSADLLNGWLDPRIRVN